MKNRIDTTFYEFAYGCEPRGYAHWVFEYQGTEYVYSGSYSEAKKAVSKELASQGITHACIRLSA